MIHSRSSFISSLLIAVNARFNASFTKSHVIKILFCLLDELNYRDNGEHLIEKCVNDIALQVGCSQSLVSHQLKVLKDGGFVKSNKVGTKIYYSLKDEHVRQIMHITYEHVLEGEEDE